MSKIKCEICGISTSRMNNKKRLFMAQFPLDVDRTMSIQEVWIKEEIQCLETDGESVKQEVDDRGDDEESEVPSDLYLKSHKSVNYDMRFAVKSEPLELDHEQMCEREINPEQDTHRSVDDSTAPAVIYKREKPRKIKRNFTIPRFTTYECADCGKRFPYKSHLVRHMQVHLEKKFYRCDICQKQFTSKFNYKGHVRLHTGEKSFACRFCDKKFPLKSYLTRHQLTHKDDKIYACDICDKQFSVRRYLVTHRLLHVGDNSHTCGICNKQFAIKSYLITHLLTHSEGKAYSCDVCEKQFENKTSLNLHKRTHVHNCSVCGKKFQRKHALAEHMMIHTKKAYECSVCGKKFTLKCNLNSHFRIHTGEKRFSCEVCKKRFTFKSNLKSHYRYYPGDHRNPDDAKADLFAQDSSENEHQSSTPSNTLDISIKRSPSESSEHSITIKYEPIQRPSGDMYLDSQLTVKKDPDEELFEA